jgi:uncharacterized membrane protein YphA (DoxX/SURF4 family)
MEQVLDRLHAHARAHPVFQRLAIISRILLALAFVPTGLVKVMGERFTALSIDNPIGLFFEAMYQSGGYWNFVGWAQVVAGVLLLVPRTTTLGAVLFFPIVLNIFVITVSLHFRGTPWITGAMLLASVFLLCWDYDRLKTLVWPPASSAVRSRRVPIGRLEQAGYVVGTCAGLGVFGWTRGFVPQTLLLFCFGLGVLAALVVLIAWVRAARISPGPHAPERASLPRVH